MVPLRLLKNGLVQEISGDGFRQSIIEVCTEHRKDKRALAFAFILYDFENPQMLKILNDRDYWNALNAISGRFLSIYYVHSRETTFGEDLGTIGCREQRGLYPIEGNEDIGTVGPMLKRYLELEEDVKNPSILFFQVEGGLISDYFLIELFEEKIEESFVELKDYISSAVNRLKMIDPKNYRNTQPIFECLKEGVRSTKLRKSLFRNVQKFPVQLLISWFVGRL